MNVVKGSTLVFEELVGHHNNLIYKQNKKESNETKDERATAFRTKPLLEKAASEWALLHNTLNRKNVTPLL
jgi:hypothetical protein